MGSAVTEELVARLERWVAAGLVTPEAADAIARFEAAAGPHVRAGRATRAVALLGALTVASGVGSLVAYNWGRFGATFKLVSMALLLAVGAALTAHARFRRPQGGTLFDVFALLTASFCLAGLGLVSQVYDQDGELWQLLFVWCALVAPVLYFTRGIFAQVYAYFALWISLLSSGGAVNDSVRAVVAGRQEWATALILFGGGLLLSLSFWRSGGGQSITDGGESIRSEVGSYAAQGHLLVLGSLGGLLWLDAAPAEPLLVGTSLGLLGLVWLFVPKDVTGLGWGGRQQVLGLFSVGFLLIVPACLVNVHSGILAFAAFSLFWAFAWWLAERAGAERTARLAVFLLAIRVVIASFELFESLLVTGSVLVALGSVALAFTLRRLRAEPMKLEVRL